MSLEIGSDFDALVEPAWNDGARIERLAGHVFAQQRRPRRKRFVRIAALAACLLLVAGIAAASALRWIGPQEAPLVATFTGLRPSPTAAPWQSKVRAPIAPALSASSVAVLDSASALPPLVPAQNPSTRNAVVAPHPGSSAAQLFRSANDARRAGQTQKAVQLYRALQHDHSGSPEAVLSSLSLGGVLLSTDSVSALQQFDHYLAASPKGALAAEALYGRGRALEALGKKAEERSTWQELFARYPSSPYRDRALRRLSDVR